ncbi:uncharacterized protein [Palaemon carinicauda]|uniref:uncharacterized protein n=1 Tax=Palaemon carinicauda TaxID=392227 RepID=UPI0035B5BDA8
MEQLHRAKAAAEGWVTRVSNRIEDLLVRDPPPTSCDLIEALEEMDKRLFKLEEVQDKLEMLLEPEELENYLEQADRARLRARQTRLRCANRLKDISAAGISDDDRGSSASTASIHARLPKLELPRFDGEITQWQSFWDQFSSHIDNTELPVISKLTYLLSLLDGPAKDVVQGVPHTSASYRTVVDLLKERFGKSVCIIHAHVQALLSLQVPVNQGKSYTKQLWRLRDEVIKRTRSLDALGVTGNQCEVLLTPIIVSRLPMELRLQWSRECSGHESDLEWLLEWLKREIEVLERSEMYRKNIPASGPHGRNEERKNINSKDGRDNLYTTPALHAVSQSEGSNCVFCTKLNHKSERCHKFLALDGQQRYDKIRELGVCFKCLNKGHISKNCKVRCTKCQGGHNVVMCGIKVNMAPQTNVENGDHVAPPSASMLSGHYSNKTVLQTAKVKVMNNKGGFVTAKLLFDSGCDRSYVSSKFTEICKPEWVTRTEAPYSSFGGHSSGKDIETNVYKLNVLDNKGEIIPIFAASIPKICNPLVRPVVPTHILDAFSHLDLADDFDDSSLLEIDILIGLDYYWSLMNPEDAVQVGKTVAMSSVFGWVLSGNVGKGCNFTKVVSTSSLSDFVSSSPQLLSISGVSDADMSYFWDLETIGITSKECKEDIKESVVQEFEDKIDFVNGRYEVQLPWKNNSIKDSLMSNVNQAMKRLNKLLVRFEKDGDLKDAYMNVFDEYASLGIIEEIPSEDLVSQGPIYYMPHRPVVKLNSSTTKIRPVFDASAKGPIGISLNDCMLTGPSLNPDLVEILIRFRRWPYVISADVVKAFLQINVHSQDKNVHRFLMPGKDGVRHMRFNRVVFGNTSSPFLLNVVVKHHLSNYSECEAVQDLKRDMYVDNWFSGADTVEEVATKFKTAYDIMADANMSLEKVSSNSVVIASKFKDKMQILSDDEINMVLGLKWSNYDDKFSYFGLHLGPDFEISYTKRTVLSLIAKVFDPCGFISPFIMYAKIIFQDIWKLGISWDDKLPDELERKFKKWIDSTRYFSSLAIRRCYFTNVPWKSIEHIEIHGFGDASEKGFGACVYLRVCLGNDCQSSLVMSKARVAPIKKLTLPKLELMGALLCARLVRFVERALDFKIKPGIVCWTDSTITLGWIRSDSVTRDVFVNIRVREIQHLTPPSHWHHCSGSNNPADLMTRGLLADKLIGNNLWFSGPCNLSDPTFSIQDGDNSIIVNETVNYESEDHLVCLSVQTATPMFDVEKYNNLNKSIRIVGYVQRFMSNCKAKGSGVAVNTGGFTTEELDKAKARLIYVVQREAFPSEIQALSDQRLIPKNSKLRKLDPFIDDKGIVRIKGRLQFSDLGYESKHPIILPKGHFSKLLVQFQHKFLKHAGVNSIVSSLRSSFHVTGVRRMAKTVVRECLDCCRHDSRPCSQPAAPLPDLRVTPAPPFAVTGIDFAGPVFSADYQGKKLYMLLFTCAIVRAVHLELTESMSLVDFMQALWKFAARRGIPSVIYSDNAKTFVAASSEVQKVFGHLAPKWRFNVPRSPWNITSKPPVDIEPYVVTPDDLRDREEIVNKRLEQFWSVWRKDYIANLPPVVKGFNQKCRLNVGSTVLVKEDHMPRLQWPIGVIVNVYPGRDGLIRSVDVKTRKGIVNRSIQRLHDLEINAHLNPGLNNLSVEVPEHVNDNSEMNIDVIDDKTAEQNPNGNTVVDGNMYSKKGRQIKRPHKLDL